MFLVYTPHLKECDNKDQMGCTNVWNNRNHAAQELHPKQSKSCDRTYRPSTSYYSRMESKCRCMCTFTHTVHSFTPTSKSFSSSTDSCILKKLLVFLSPRFALYLPKVGIILVFQLSHLPENLHYVVHFKWCSCFLISSLIIRPIVFSFYFFLIYEKVYLNSKMQRIMLFSFSSVLLIIFTIITLSFWIRKEAQKQRNTVWSTIRERKRKFGNEIELLFLM